MTIADQGGKVLLWSIRNRVCRRNTSKLNSWELDYKVRNNLVFHEVTNDKVERML